MPATPSRFPNPNVTRSRAARSGRLTWASLCEGMLRAIGRPVDCPEDVDDPAQGLARFDQAFAQLAGGDNRASGDTVHGPVENIVGRDRHVPGAQLGQVDLADLLPDAASRPIPRGLERLAPRGRFTPSLVPQTVRAPTVHLAVPHAPPLLFAARTRPRARP